MATVKHDAPPVTLRTRIHVVLLVTAVALGLVCALPRYTFFDALSLKPKAMHPAIREVARITNIPIKLGMVHLAFYLVEFFRDPAMFQRHCGQRLGTLWWQFLLQNERWGQHLQMQIETCMQVADAMQRRDVAKYSSLHLLLFAVITALLLCQAALTSLGWHDFDEQFKGFCLAIVKLAFDYSPLGQRLNFQLGTAFAVAVHWIGGSALVAAAHAVNDFAPLHPTLTMTLFFAGALALSLVLPRLLPVIRSVALRGRAADAVAVS